MSPSATTPRRDLRTVKSMNDATIEPVPASGRGATQVEAGHPCDGPVDT